ncbi:actin or actin-binding cytoskeletal protein [Lithospermum erythrorhizon]|uniref:Actin or actin-binding cytoskeletal protein n=1 Tax=Lithospermum erythrorhizon TaxID=34254 RepID=A0AAV3PI65_LITER
MGWITKIFKGSSHKGQYHGKYQETNIWEQPSTSPDAVSDFDHEEIDHAIALSLAETDEKEYFDNDEGQKQTSAAEEDHKIHSSAKEAQKVNADADQDEDHSRNSSGKEDQKINFAADEAHNRQSPSAKEDQQWNSSPEKERKGKGVIDNESQLVEDEQLAKALQESLIVDSPPQYDYGSFFPPYPYFYPTVYRICAGCHADIGHGRFLSCMDTVWHPECFRCHVCDLPISDYEFSMSENRPYHKSCYKDQHHPKCDVCMNFIPTNPAGLIEYRAHPFWMQKYCPLHEFDGTSRCCSCERMEPVDSRFLVLDDGRRLCLECLDSAIMDTNECQPLYLEILEFYEGLNMKVEQAIPILLVERQALNEAIKGEKIGHHHLPETRGLCLSEEQTVSTILRRPQIGGYRIVDMFTEPYKLIRKCEVTAILILFGLPRLLTGSILAHEMMHAWLRLKGYPNLHPNVEEGICQVMAHLWLDSETISGSSSSTTSTSAPLPSSSSSSSSSGSSKKGKRSDFEKKMGEFFKHQIESDTSTAYGDGFREGNQAVLKYGLKRTLDHIKLTGCFP